MTVCDKLIGSVKPLFYRRSEKGEWVLGYWNKVLPKFMSSGSRRYIIFFFLDHPKRFFLFELDLKAIVQRKKKNQKSSGHHHGCTSLFGSLTRTKKRFTRLIHRRSGHSTVIRHPGWQWSVEVCWWRWCWADVTVASSRESWVHKSHVGQGMWVSALHFSVIVDFDSPWWRRTPVLNNK